MKTLVGLVLALGVLVGALTGCGVTGEGKTVDGHYGLGDDEITVRIGETFWVELPSNPATGFHWTIATLETEWLRPLKNKWRPGGKRIDDEGIRAYQFRAQPKSRLGGGVGETMISLIYWNPSSGEVAIEQHYVVIIVDVVVIAE